MIPIDYRRMERAVFRGTLRAIILGLLLLVLIAVAVQVGIAYLGSNPQLLDSITPR